MQIFYIKKYITSIKINGIFKMNILIIGSGAVGIGLASSMLSQKANISIYSTGKTAKAIKENGIKRTGLFTNYSFSKDELEVYEKYEEIPKDKFDYVFITSKTTANEDISQKLNKYRNILKENFKIIIFQNGFGNDEYFLRYFNKDHIFCARVITGFIRPKRHVSEVTVYTEPIAIGSIQNSPVDDLQIIADMITESGIKCEITKDIDKLLWAKMLYNSALNPLGAILNVNYGKLTENKYSIEIMDKIIDEIFDVINASQYTTFWENSNEYKKIFYSKLVPDTYNHYSSTYQDIQRKRRTEIDSLNGKIIELGEKYDEIGRAHV